MTYLGVSQLVCRYHRSKCVTLLFRDNNYNSHLVRSYGVSYKNPYTVLKIKPGATKKEIKAAYYDLSKELHPDKHRGDPGKSAQYLEVQEAYSSLMQTGADNSNNAYTKARPRGPQKSRSDPYAYTRMYESNDDFIDKKTERGRYVRKRGMLQLSIIFIPLFVYFIVVNRLKRNKRKQAIEAQYGQYLVDYRKQTEAQSKITEEDHNSVQTLDSLNR